MEKEIWKLVKGFEGAYEVSNLGAIRSVERFVERNGSLLHIHGRMIRQNCLKGYKRVQLRKNGHAYNVLVHRVVAEAFIPNPNGYKYVNHKDECRYNNCVENLEWCTFEYNINYGTARQRRKDKISKQVLQYDKHGNLVAEYASTVIASKALSVAPSNISVACNNHKTRTVRGFTLMYKY